MALEIQELPDVIRVIVLFEFEQRCQNRESYIEKPNLNVYASNMHASKCTNYTNR